MLRQFNMPNRRTVIAGLAASTLALGYDAQTARAGQPSLQFKTGKALPAIGMGTWQTFNINPHINPLANPETNPERKALSRRRQVLKEFYKAGGGMIDSSPMYGRAEAVLGVTRNPEEEKQTLFSATKIWTPLKSHGAAQLTKSHRLWKEPVLDLVYVHNLLNWEDHLKTLRAAQDAGTVRYIGLTTSHGRRHDDLETLIMSEPIEAVQITYNVLNREVENRLLPLIEEKGLSLIINRPFMGGHLFRHVAGKDIPPWAAESLQIESWAEFFLKYVISHPAVSGAIPATSNPAHMQENMRARLGPMPGAKLREKMAAFMAEI